LKSKSRHSQLLQLPRRFNPGDKIYPKASGFSPKIVSGFFIWLKPKEWVSNQNPRAEVTGQLKINHSCSRVYIPAAPIMLAQARSKLVILLLIVG
jgi:hypothetical protein